MRKIKCEKLSKIEVSPENKTALFYHSFLLEKEILLIKMMTIKRNLNK